MSTVLIADDTRTDRELMAKVVAAAGHQSVYAEDGEQAVARATEMKPSLVLMDVVMPTMNGFNACRKLKSNPVTAQIPIVLVTTKSTESDRFWGKKQGADDHICKPFTPNELLEVIKRFVR